MIEPGLFLRNWARPCAPAVVCVAVHTRVRLGNGDGLWPGLFRTAAGEVTGGVTTSRPIAVTQSRGTLRPPEMVGHPWRGGDKSLQQQWLRIAAVRGGLLRTAEKWASDWVFGIEAVRSRHS